MNLSDSGDFNVSDNAYRLSQLSKVIFGRASRMRILAVLAAYFDASGHDDRSKYLVVAGFVAPVDKWVEFEVQWEALLHSPRYNLEYAHARKLIRLGATKRDTFYHEANYLLKKYISFAVASTIKKSDYDAAFGKNYPLTVKDSLYPLCFRIAMVSVCKHVPESFPGETCAFIIERGDPNQGGAKKIFDMTKADVTKAGADAFQEVKNDFPVDTLTIADKKDFGALQVADMHVYSKLKHQESRFRQMSNKSHPLLARLLNDLNVSHFDATQAELREQRIIHIENRNKRIAYGKRRFKNGP